MPGQVPRLWALACVLLSSSPASAQPATREKFSVRDSIEMTRLAEPFLSADAPHDAVGTYPSPDATQVALLTRCGDLTSGRNEFSLLLLSVKAIREFLASPAGAARPVNRLILRRWTASYRNAIDHLAWLDSTRLAFIGRDEQEEVGQVYVVDVRSGAVTKLTDTGVDIRRFSVSADGSTVLYAQPTLTDWSERNRHGYALAHESLGELLNSDPRRSSAASIRYFVLDLKSGRTIALETSPVYLPLQDAISPDGRYAAAEVMAPVPYPEAWAAYGFFSERASGVSLRELFSAPVPLVNRFQLFDLSHGSVRHLTEAPAILLGFAVKPAWSPDSRRVIVGPGYLPLAGLDAEERARRSQVPAMIEVDIASGRITRVTDVPMSGNTYVRTVEWESADCIRLQRVRYATTEIVHEPPEKMCKDAAVWVEKERVPAIAHPLRFEVVQDMNTAPELAAIDPRSGREAVISDFNPRWRTLDLGRVERFTWKDSLGRELTGGLLKPPAFQSGVRYPVVLQTYGFDPNEFLLDGPRAGYSTAFAARALAANDLLVLQMPLMDGGLTGKESDYAQAGQGPRFVAGMEGAIDALDSQGLIDRNRVGLIGFSATGQHVQHALVFSKYFIAAATVADAVQDTPFCYSLVSGAGYLEFEEPLTRIGASFWGQGIRNWQERSTAFHLDRVRTAIRFEHIGTYGPPCTWDAYTFLRRHRRAVEMVHLPMDVHDLRTPFARYTSLQGNVDWFGFWLKGEARQTPYPGTPETADSLAEQYARWLLLRAQQDVVLH